MFKISNNYNTEELKNNIYNIKNLIYKVSTNTLLRADDAVQHIKRNKKIYKNMILYLAICMSPELIRHSHYLIIEFIRALAIIPKENLLSVLVSFFREIGLCLISFMITKDIIINAFNFAINKIKNN